MRKSNVQSGLVGLVAMLLVAPAGADVSVTISSAGAYRNQVVDVFVILMREGSPAADDFNPPIPTGMNLDLVYPTNVITTPSCFLDPDLAGLGFRLSTSEDIPGGGSAYSYTGHWMNCGLRFLTAPWPFVRLPSNPTHPMEVILCGWRCWPFQTSTGTGSRPPGAQAISGFWAEAAHVLRWELARSRSSRWHC